MDIGVDHYDQRGSRRSCPVSVRLLDKHVPHRCSALPLPDGDRRIRIARSPRPHFRRYRYVSIL
jgi:hypothetical protein